MKNSYVKFWILGLPFRTWKIITARKKKKRFFLDEPDRIFIGEQQRLRFTFSAAAAAVTSFSQNKNISMDIPNIYMLLSRRTYTAGTVRIPVYPHFTI